MKVLVIGSGGREHAIVWSLSKCKRVDKIYCCPGNAGISQIAECIDISPNDFNAILDMVRYEWIDFTIVGPEAPLSEGIVDTFEKKEMKIIGPNRLAAQLESSKVFAKEFMKRHAIPTAEYKVFTSYLHAEEYVRLKGVPIVVKADGLAAGKGVIVAQTEDEAITAVRLIVKDKAFDAAGDRVVIEECLSGEEASFIVFTDNKTIVPMVSSQDHKRIHDGDKGPNTGGMGAYTPAPIVTKTVQKKIMDRIMGPAIVGLQKEGIKYKGILYAGLMINNGDPYVLEFNCRFGDPEAQPILMKLDTDLLDIILAIHDETLNEMDIKWKSGSSICVVLASNGYPGKYEKGKTIKGLDSLEENEKVFAFHAGTGFSNGDIVTSGGRVIGVTALGKDIKDARDTAYDAIKNIHFDGMYYRRDIAYKALS